MSKTKLIATLLASALYATAASAAWAPEKPVEFIVASGAGGGTDTFARTIQAIIIKYKLMAAPVVVLNKGGGAGSEGFVYGSSNPDDPYKVTFGTNNEYLLPLVAKMGYTADSLVPVAALALDEFLIWVHADSPYKDTKSFIEAAKKGDGLKMGGSQSKDTDQTLVSMISAVTGAKFTYIPFKSGGEAAVQLAGGHTDSNTNNPSENIGQWKANMVRPLCVFSTKRMAAGPKVTKDMAWSDIPLCKDEGVAIPTYQMPRTVWLPKGVSADAMAFYSALLKKVSETPEWKSYNERASQTDTFMTGDTLKAYIKQDTERATEVFKREKWLVQ
jgi:tripartite-type tricarboxylate transporter receptor subunit TctC